MERKSHGYFPCQQVSKSLFFGGLAILDHGGFSTFSQLGKE